MSLLPAPAPGSPRLASTVNPAQGTFGFELGAIAVVDAHLHQRGPVHSREVGSPWAPGSERPARPPPFECGPKRFQRLFGSDRSIDFDSLQGFSRVLLSQRHTRALSLARWDVLAGAAGKAGFWDCPDTQLPQTGGLKALAGNRCCWASQSPALSPSQPVRRRQGNVSTLAHQSSASSFHNPAPGRILKTSLAAPTRSGTGAEAGITALRNQPRFTCSALRRLKQLLALVHLRRVAAGGELLQRYSALVSLGALEAAEATSQTDSPHGGERQGHHQGPRRPSTAPPCSAGAIAPRHRRAPAWGDGVGSGRLLLGLGQVGSVWRRAGRCGGWHQQPRCGSAPGPPCALGAIGQLFETPQGIAGRAERAGRDRR